MLSSRLKWRIKSLANFHRRGNRPDIFLFSTARSGSTWLMELVNTQPGLKFVNEPLLMPQFSDGGPLPASWDLLLPHSGREEALETYFRAIIANRCGVGSPAPFTRFHRWRTDRIIFKMLRCMDMMNWFEETFDCRIVYLVRHPLAVSLSRKLTPMLGGFLSSDEYCERFLSAEQREFATGLSRDGDDLDRKVLDWCLQNLPPLKHLDRSGWHCLHYEDLVLDPVPRLRELAVSLRLPDPERMLRGLAVPSTSASFSDRDTREFLGRAGGGADRGFLVTKWRQRIDPERERRCFEILERFDVSVYGFGEDLPVHRLDAVPGPGGR